MHPMLTEKLVLRCFMNRFIRSHALTFILLLAAQFITARLDAQAIWRGPSVTFTKTDYADPTQAANQDTIVPGVSITRADTQGLYNAITDGGYNGSGPSDTEWAYGTTAQIGTLVF